MAMNGQQRRQISLPPRRFSPAASLAAGLSLLLVSCQIRRSSAVLVTTYDFFNSTAATPGQELAEFASSSSTHLVEPVGHDGRSGKGTGSCEYCRLPPTSKVAG